MRDNIGKLRDSREGDFALGVNAFLHQRFEAAGAKAQLLRNFAAILSNDDVRKAAVELLPSVLAEAEDLRIRRVVIADACQMSEATVSRWAAGTVRPHAMVARATIEAIAEIALQNAKRLDDDAAGIMASAATHPQRVLR